MIKALKTKLPWDKYGFILTIIAALIPVTGTVGASIIGAQVYRLESGIKARVLKEAEEKFATKESVHNLKEDVQEIKAGVNKLNDNFTRYIIQNHN